MDLAVIATVVLAITVGVISPGPTFIVVARTALSATPRLGRIAALGVGTASLAFSVLAAAGVSAVLAYVGWLFVVLKVAGGAYLVVLAVRLWRSHGTSGIPVGIEGDRRAYMTGLLTQLSNPKTIVIYGSVFVTLLPPHTSVATLIALPIATTAVEVLWYSLVATTSVAAASAALLPALEPHDRSRGRHVPRRARRLLRHRRRAAGAPLTA